MTIDDETLCAMAVIAIGGDVTRNGAVDDMFDVTDRLGIAFDLSEEVVQGARALFIARIPFDAEANYDFR
jgi:hypothetical protein